MSKLVLIHLIESSFFQDLKRQFFTHYDGAQSGSTASQGDEGAEAGV